MLTAALFLLACAVLCWPVSRAHRRLRAIAGTQPRARARFTLPAAGPAAAVVGVTGAAGLVLFGTAGGIVGVAFGATAVWRYRRGRAVRRRLTVIGEVAEALAGLVTELNAGAHPAAAAESVAAEGPHDSVASVALRTVAAAARLGGDADAMVTTATAAANPEVHGVMTRLARAWTLAQRHGVPLADAVDAVRRDLEATSRFAGRLRAKLAGPRASAAVLGCLPFLGLLLGEAMGARPSAVLASTATGQALLLIGGGLMLAGVAWTARLTSQAVEL